jgi:hypothetical protein
LTPLWSAASYLLLSSVVGEHVEDRQLLGVRRPVARFSPLQVTCCFRQSLGNTLKFVNSLECGGLTPLWSAASYLLLSSVVGEHVEVRQLLGVRRLDAALVRGGMTPRSRATIDDSCEEPATSHSRPKRRQVGALQRVEDLRPFDRVRFICSLNKILLTAADPGRKTAGLTLRELNQDLYSAESLRLSGTRHVFLS